MLPVNQIFLKKNKKMKVRIFECLNHESPVCGGDMLRKKKTKQNKESKKISQKVW
jgi:hypothetical protein